MNLGEPGVFPTIGSGAAVALGLHTVSRPQEAGVRRGEALRGQYQPSGVCLILMLL